jgi:two-component sensor histidine kinase
MAAADLAEALEDELFALRQQTGADDFPKPAMEYLNDWADQNKGWLRKFYRSGTDDPQFDLTPATEKAINWLSQLSERSFIGTESRLLTLFELLKQMSEGTEADPVKRLAELGKRRQEIDREIEQVKAGHLPLLDDTALKDRFQQFVQLARDLLGDFREVEHNFRQLDRKVRERIALWGGAKGDLLEDVMGERDAIADSDQGRSFRAFWDFLMSTRRQEELTLLLDRVLALPPVAILQPDARLRRVHHEAGENAQRTVARLSQQLRRFLDDQAWLENRRIMEILRSIESRALAIRADPPSGDITVISNSAASIELPMERPLHATTTKAALTDVVVATDEAEVDPAALYDQVVVDKARLISQLRRALQTGPRISLGELIERYPLQQGLAELIAYLQLGEGTFHAIVDETVEDLIAWQVADGGSESVRRHARLPRIIFERGA